MSAELVIDDFLTFYSADLDGDVELARDTLECSHHNYIDQKSLKLLIQFLQEQVSTNTGGRSFATERTA